MEIKSTNKVFGGLQHVTTHASRATGTQMELSVFVPPQANDGPVPVLIWLSGLTCTQENFTTKAGAQRAAAEHGLMVIAPDTSPRGPGIPDDPDGAYDFGLGAGFYVNATEPPFATHYKMRDYIESEVLEAVAAGFPADTSRVSLAGHSMGGHGALTIALRNPDRYTSVSAFAPIVSPLNCPWGEKALTGYLGPDRAAWREYDACALIEDGARVNDMLVDQGLADNFLEEQLKPELLEDAVKGTDIALTLRRHEGYDHSYYFIASFIDDHIRWHAERLKA